MKSKLEIAEKHCGTDPFTVVYTRAQPVALRVIPIRRRRPEGQRQGLIDSKSRNTSR